MTTRFISYCLLFIILFFGCNAPRENPLDPENPSNNFATLTGTVRATSFPNRPLQGTNVFWSKQNILVKTNLSGNFTISDIRPEDGFLYFEKEGYSSDSFYVDWKGQTSANVVQYLNSIPKLADGSIISSVENKSSSIQNYKVIVNVRITDDENDVDSVFIFNEELNIRRLLNNISVTVYQNDFTPSQLNLSSIGAIIGKEFSILAKDASNKEFNIAELTVKRVIRDPIDPISPLNSEIVGDTVNFVWTRFTPGYPFHYMLQIYYDTVEPELVVEIDNISSEDISYELIGQLNPDNYFWVLWVIDEFGDRARSSPRKFIVE